jgi:glutathione S-transferase
MSDDPLTLYVIPVSHPAYAAQLMLAHKGLEHRLVRLTSGFHRPLLQLMGFWRGTVPSLRVGRKRIEGSLEIPRALDEIAPEPPLRPADPAARRRHDEVERWGEQELQPVPRRLYRWSLCESADVRRGLTELNGLPLPGTAATLMLRVSPTCEGSVVPVFPPSWLPSWNARPASGTD